MRASRAALLALSVPFAVPLWLMTVAALRAPATTGSAWWPSAPTFESFAQALALVPLGRGLLNSLWVAGVAVPITVAVASSCAFALTLLPKRHQLALVVVLLAVASIPATALWIPRFVAFHALGWVGGYVPLIAPALTGGSPIFVLLYYLAVRRIPVEVIEAARLEGASLPGIWWKVVLPLTLPTTVAVALLAAVQFWNSFMDALLYLRAERALTSPLMLQSLEQLGPTNWPVLMAGSLLVSLPLLLAFVLLQRFLASPERASGWLGR